MKAIIAIVAMSLGCLLGAASDEGIEKGEVYHVAKQTRELETYVDWYLGHYKARAKLSREEYIPVVVREANKHGIDPLIPGIVISFESSWMTGVMGKQGEIGLMQIMPGGFCHKGGHDIETPEGSIKTGISCLKFWIDKCDGDLRGALSGYQGSSRGCKKYIKGAEKRFSAYIAAINLVSDEEDNYGPCQQNTDSNWGPIVQDWQ